MPRKAKPPEYVRPSDLAEEAGLSRIRIYQLIEAGRIEAHDVAGYVLIPRAAADAWLRSREDKGVIDDPDPIGTTRKRKRGKR